MTNEDYLDGSMYHISHFENLRSILNSGALLSQKELESRKIKWHSIANREVQDLRRRIYVWDLFEKQFRPLHSYVPFYFTTHTPMFLNQRERGCHPESCVKGK
jgi:ssDNA thymidine ADP-ribosyltransferase DarT-like protein